MKPMVAATLLSLVVALATMAQTPPRKSAETAKPQAASGPPVIKCKGADGRACTSKQVQALADAVFAGKRQHEVLALFKNLTLVSSDGVLKCEQNDGTPCTTQQLDLVKEIAAGQQMFINYNSSKSNTGN
jgi:hypothetical protein